MTNLREPIKVSVIVPVFNEERAVSHALDSILLQDTTFGVEIIVVDDGSTDGTAAAVTQKATKHGAIRLLRNERNLGKGPSFNRGYEAARGEYVHVLDADDWFVNRHKLQRQVEFLEAHQDYFAVGHNTLVCHPDGFSLISHEVQPRDWSNDQCLAGRIYSHTSAILYRKRSDPLPDCFMEEEFRGDSAVFFYHAFRSRQKFRFLPGVWSIYNFHGRGIWSRLSVEQQREFNLRIINAFRNRLVCDPGGPIDKLLEDRANHMIKAKRNASTVEPSSLDGVLKFAEQASSKVFHFRDEAFRGMYAFRLVDELCEAVGRSLFLELGGRVLSGDYRTDRVALIVSGLVPGGGGVFREIEELVRLLVAAGHSVELLSTQKIATQESVFENLCSCRGVRYWLADDAASSGERLRALLARLLELRPAIVFPFITHNDPIGCAAIQAGTGGQIVFDFVYDHGLSLGILSSSIDRVMVKTVSQAQALRAMLPRETLSLVPPFMQDRTLVPPYQPLRTGRLTTASAAARPYKVEAKYRYSYSEVVVRLLAETRGRHIHYGPLGEKVTASIRAGLAARGISPDQFEHIPWADDLGGSLLEQGVDLFVAPFPICSARISLEVMSCGIPSLNHMVAQPRMPQGIDFIDPQQFTWRIPDDLFKLIAGLNKDVLLEKSASARDYFLSKNLPQRVAERLLDGSPLIIPPNDRPPFTLSEFSDTFPVEVTTPLFGGKKISIRPASANASSMAAPTDKFWHRTATRRSIRQGYYMLRRLLLLPKR